jgi:serine/threonine protein kinase
VSESFPPDSGNLNRAFAIDRWCDEFEAEWKAGGSPRIEDYLARVADPDRPTLFAELIGLEVSYRRMRGETPGRDEYLVRFPGHEQPIHSLLPDPVRETTILSETGPHSDSEPASALPTVPGYEILGELGRGGMGVVYKARELALDRVVALKMLLAGAHAGRDQRARFLTEARTTAQLHHPDIVQIHAVGEAGGLPYLALEFVAGGSLKGKLDCERLSPADAATVVERLARAVAYAHERSIVHRDLKPGNVLLTETGEPKLTDFGLAKLTDAAGITRSQTGCGTPHYMAPEQARDAKNVGAAADVYALGVILFEALTGRVPFSGESDLAVLSKVANEEAPSPRVLRPEVPRELDAICLTCLEKAPDARYPSAAVLAEELANFLAGRPLVHTRRRGSDGHPDRLVVGIDPNCPPYAFREGGRLTGFDVDLAGELAARLGLSVEYLERDWRDWDDMRRQLDAREVDILISAVTVTDQRKREVAFVEYAHDPLVFTARSGSGLRGKTDLVGKTVAVQAGTSAHSAVERLQRGGAGFKQILTYPSTPEPFAAVRDGVADLTLDHQLIARYFCRSGLELMGLVGYSLSPEPLAIALRKEDQVRKAQIEEVLAAMKEDGTYGDLQAKWAGQ